MPLLRVGVGLWCLCYSSTKRAASQDSLLHYRAAPLSITSDLQPQASHLLPDAFTASCPSHSRYRADQADCLCTQHRASLCHRPPEQLWGAIRTQPQHLVSGC